MQDREQTESRRLSRSLDPRLRALGILLIVTAGLLGVFLAIGGGELGANDVLLSVYIGLFAVYIMYRTGQFATRVPVYVQGEDRPRTHKMRKTAGGKRFRPTAPPKYISAAEADDELQPEERVIGVEINGQAVAYPLSAMALREAANEEVDDEAVTVTWWPVTYSARAFAARLPNDPTGEPIELEPGNQTVLNSSVLLDEVGSGWVQFLGQAVTGPRAGWQMKDIPTVSTNWRAWRDAHPDTDVLSKEGTPEFDVFERYYTSDRAGLHRQPALDKRWMDKEIVLGVEVNGEAKAFPYSALIEQPLVQEDIGGEPVLVALERISATALAFSRRVDGRTLSFVKDSPNPRRPEMGEDFRPEDIRYEPLYLRDNETGSRWRMITGECMEGELKGARLSMLPGKTAFWFAWTHFYPNAAVVEPQSPVGPEAEPTESAA